jgi:uncharacterized cofD-like protein
VRRSLLALGADASTTQIMERLFAYRVPAAGPSGLSFGRIFLNALTDIMGTHDLALQAAAQVLNVQGRVLPITLQACPLIAELDAGREETVRTSAELRAVAAQGTLQAVQIAHQVPVLEAALEAVYSADIIVLGPANLFFNVLAPLQIEELRTAIATSRAVKIFVCNILTEPHITEGWSASRFLRRVLGYLGGAAHLDHAIINSTLPAAGVLECKAAGYTPVALDLDECLALGSNIIARPVAAPETLYHDPEKLARTILFLGGERAQRRAGDPLVLGRDTLPPATPIALAPRGANS